MRIPRRTLRRALYAFVLLGLMFSNQPLAAQQPKLSLGATKDQKGYWEIRPGLGGAPRPADVPFQPWAKALYDYRQSRTDL